MIEFFSFGLGLGSVYGPEYLLKLYLSGTVVGSIFYLGYHAFVAPPFQVSRNIELGLAALRGEKGPAYDRIVLNLLFQVSRNIELGLAALHGEKGPAYDRIVLNAGMVDHLLGCDGAEDVSAALDRARDAVDSGKALNRLLGYITKSIKLASQ